MTENRSTGDGLTAMPARIDVRAVRADTPGTLHRIHLNNAGASLMPTSVLETVVSHLELEASIGGYEAAEVEAERLAGVYASVASLLNCSPDEIGVLENATRAWQAAFFALGLRARDRVITGRAEYCSNYMVYRAAIEQLGISVTVVDDDRSGQIDVDQLSDAIDDRVRLIAVTHVPTDNALVNPIEQVGRVARQAEVPLLVDACQSVGQLPIDVQEIGCDFLTSAGRKFLRAPRGTGILYVRGERLEALRPAIPEIGSMYRGADNGYSLRPDARRFETWEASYASRLGLGRAVDYALELGSQAIWARVVMLGTMLRQELADMPHVVIHDRGETKCGIVALSVAGTDPLDAKAYLARRGINVDVATVETTAANLRPVELKSVVRAAVHYFNTEEEISAMREAVAGLASARQDVCAA